MAKRCKISPSIVAESEQRSYVLKVDGYTTAKKQFGTGKYVVSAPFSAGGYNWVMNCYPNEPVPKYSRTVSGHAFSGKGRSWGYHNFIKKADLEGSDYLRDDSFSIRCDVTVLKHIQKGNQLQVVPPSDLHQHLDDLLKSMDGADVIFNVSGERFPAHRAVLAARSSVFKAELFGAMKEKDGNPIQIDDMEADATREGDACGDVVMAGHLLVAADRYNVERLKLIREHKLCKHLSNIAARVKEVCLQFLDSPSNVEAMMASDGYEHLKTSCPSVLKELVARFVPAELQEVLMSI
ncbi:hypothetical protein BRADI_4g23825v3 [Brachypodium distachyon]|uniref:BTB domain-containing protein n=1 Tax=Brachypodium distachyon TaxID=15368 RepID=A0A2K2CPV8_BRADI|nr:hypothetical protein BRADI_4g23825v3 [Brachypodium distachyon]